MATISDIDIAAAVKKFLDRSIVVSKSGVDYDQSDEIAAVLEAVAISFLLAPQTALTFILMAKNQLQQIVGKDVEYIDFISKAVNDVENPDNQVTDVSDLVEAQTALVEIDRVGNLTSNSRAFTRYNAAINRFLDEQLATSLKRRRSGELERSGSEARQDLFSAISTWSSIHEVMVQTLSDVHNSVTDFRSVNLTKVVSQKTVGRVRNSLTKVQKGFERSSVSKTSAAIELLAGAASLESISVTKDIYDPTVETGKFPVGSNILISSEPAAATLTSFNGPYSLTNYTPSAVNPKIRFHIKVDELGPNVYTGAFPASPSTTEHNPFVLPTQNNPSLEKKPFVVGAAIDGPLIPISGGKKLYINVAGGSGYNAIDFTGTARYILSAGTLLSVDLPSTTIIQAINTQVPDVFCRYDILPNGKYEIMIIANAPGITAITILGEGRATVDGFGVITLADPSVHLNLGFSTNQVSGPPTSYSAELIVNRMNAYWGHRIIAKEEISPSGNYFTVTSLETGITSTLSFESTTLKELGFGFGGTTSHPKALILNEKGVELEPQALGLFVGSNVRVSDAFDARRSGTLTVTGFDGNRILFSNISELPRVLNGPVMVLEPSVANVQKLLSQLTAFIGTFDNDARDMQQAISPLLSAKPTQAQLADARKFLTKLRGRFIATNGSGLLDILTAIVVRDDHSKLASDAKKLLSALEERGLDRAGELLTSAKFSEFFSLTVETASRGTRFMKAVEDVMNNNFSTSIIEREQQDGIPSGQIPDNTVPVLEPSS